MDIMKLCAGNVELPLQNQNLSLAVQNVLCAMQTYTRAVTVCSTSREVITTVMKP